MLLTRRSRYLGAFAVATLSAAAGQEPVRGDLAIEADSVFFDAQKGSSVFKDLSISDGTVSIRAGEGVLSGDKRAGTWQLTGAVEVTFETATMSAESATFRFAAGRLTEGEVIGRPVVLETSAAEGLRAVRGTAGRIAYDRSRGVLTAREGVSFAYDNTTVRNCNWTYSLSDGAFSIVSDPGDKCVVSVGVSDQPP